MNKVFWLTYSVELSIRHRWLIHDTLQSLEKQFLSKREKTLKRCVCYSVSLSKGGWEAERGLRMENGQNSCDKGGGQEAERGLRLCV